MDGREVEAVKTKNKLKNPLDGEDTHELHAKVSHFNNLVICRRPTRGVDQMVVET